MGLKIWRRLEQQKQHSKIHRKPENKLNTKTIQQRRLQNPKSMTFVLTNPFLFFLNFNFFLIYFLLCCLVCYILYFPFYLSQVRSR